MLVEERLTVSDDTRIAAVIVPVSRWKKERVVLRLTTDAHGMRALIASLGSQEAEVSQAARQILVAIGGPEVPYLKRALANASEQLRLEAAKTLGEIGNPAAAHALLRALADDSAAVRLIAAESLISLGEEALAPLLSALIERSASVRTREGVRYVLRHLAAQDASNHLARVLAALDGKVPELDVPAAAVAALHETDKSPASTRGKAIKGRHPRPDCRLRLPR